RQGLRGGGSRRRKRQHGGEPRGSETASHSCIQIIIRSVIRAALAGLATLFIVLPCPARADTTDRVSKTVRVAARTPIRVYSTIAELTNTGSDRVDLGVGKARL